MSLSIKDYQKIAHETADYPKPTCYGRENSAHNIPWTYPVMGLAEEAGEVVGKYAKAIRDNDGYITVERTEDIKKELGDVMWFVAEICTVMNFDMEEVMQKNLDKLASRKARGVIHGSGDNR